MIIECHGRAARTGYAYRPPCVLLRAVGTRGAPQGRVLPAGIRYVSAVRIGCRNNPRWALVGRTEYDAIVVLDVDVDLFLYTGGAPPAAGTLQADIVRFGEHIA